MNFTIDITSTWTNEQLSHRDAYNYILPAWKLFRVTNVFDFRFDLSSFIWIFFDLPELSFSKQ